MADKKKKKEVKLRDEDEFSFIAEDEKEEKERVAKLPVLTKVDEIELPAAWGQTATNIDEVRKHRQMFNLKHGMFANVPMLCKGTACPMSAICTIPLSNRPLMKRCPIEIAAILDRYDKYCEELGIGPEDYLDQSQIKDLVDIEVKLLRVSGQLAISADFIEDVVAAVDDKGNELTRPELHKATEYERQLMERKRKILTDLKATRKASGENQNVADPSSFAAQLMRKAMQAKQMVDITPHVIIPSQSDNHTEDGEE